MFTLIIFLLGVLLALLIIPVLDNLMSVMSAWVEYKVYVLALKVYKIKQEISPSDEEQPKNPVGFQSTVIKGENK